MLPVFWKTLVKQAESCWTVSVTAFLTMVLITPFSLGPNFISKLGSVVRVKHCSSVMWHKAFHVQITEKWEKEDFPVKAQNLFDVAAFTLYYRRVKNVNLWCLTFKKTPCLCFCTLGLFLTSDKI